MQTSVKTYLGAGKAGDVFDNSPRRVDSFTLITSTSANTPHIGSWFCVDQNKPEQAQIGHLDNSILGGVLINANEHANYNNLTASLVVNNKSIGALMSFGRVIVKVAHAVKVGYVACYKSDTGEIGAAASVESIPEGYKAIPHGRFVVTNASANELAVLELGE